MARYAGLRMPSEIRNLKWRDISETKFHIQTGKTGGRDVPLFPRVAAELRKYRAESKPKEEYLFPKTRGHANNFLSWNLLSLLKQCKIQQWPLLFNTLRASCITDQRRRGLHDELLNAIFGNSARVRAKHYVKILEDDYARLSGKDAGPADVPEEFARYFPMLRPEEIRELWKVVRKSK